MRKTYTKRILSPLLVLYLLLHLTAYAFPQRCLKVLAQINSGSLSELRSFIRSGISKANNTHFFELASLPQSQEPQLYYHVENAVLKDLNETYFQDRELSAAVGSLFRKIFMEYLSQEKRLKPLAIYADYKSLRILFDGSDPSTASIISELHDLATRRFDSTVRQFSELKLLYEYGKRRIANPALWHLGGIGRTADEAALAARSARSLAQPDDFSPIQVQDFHSKALHQSFTSQVLKIEELRKDIDRILGLQKGLEKGLLVASTLTGRTRVLSQKAIYIVRKASHLRGTAYFDHIQTSFRQVFQTELYPAQFVTALSITPYDMVRLEKYVELIDLFSLPIYEPSESADLGLGSTQHGVVVIDVTGQGARNLEHTAIALANSVEIGSGNNLTLAQRAILETRKQQNLASQEFELRRQYFLKAIELIGAPGSNNPQSTLRFSGDDGVFSPTHPLTTREKIALADKMTELSEASDYRMTFLPPNYLDSRESIPESIKVKFITQGETIEKNLRNQIRLSDISKTETDKLLFGMEIVPKSDGSVILNLVIGGHPSLTMIQKIRKLCQQMSLPEHFRFGKILNLRLDPEDIHP